MEGAASTASLAAAASLLALSRSSPFGLDLSSKSLAACSPAA